MKKVLYILRNSFFFLLTLLFILSFSNMLNANLNSEKTVDMIPMFIHFVMSLFFVIYLFVEHAFQMSTKEDNRFNLSFIFVSLIMILIYSRTYFDTNMVSVYLSQLNHEEYQGLNTLFLLENMIYFDIAYIALFIYAILSKSKRKSV